MLALHYNTNTPKEGYIMQRANWAAVVAAVECYDDSVLAEAALMARHLLSNNSYDYDTSALSAALAADADEIGSDWQRVCWQNAAFESAIAQYDDEAHYDAMCMLVQAMIVRSYSWEQAFC